MILISNGVKAITKDISKRVYVCKIDGTIVNDKGIINTKKINDSIERSGTALYCKYISYMLPKIEELEKQMEAEDPSFIPDIFKISAQVLQQILTECDLDVPDFMKNINYFNYFGDWERGKKAIEKIADMYSSEPNNFLIDNKNNRLIYRFSNEARWDIRYIYDELPAEFDAKMNPSTLTIKLDVAKEHFDFKFKKIFNYYY